MSHLFSSVPEAEQDGHEPGHRGPRHQPNVERREALGKGYRSRDAPVDVPCGHRPHHLPALDQSRAQLPHRDGLPRHLHPRSRYGTILLIIN